MTLLQERSYTTVDKSDWPRGEWDDEPDKIQWVDEATGLDCLIVRGPSGALCGYVGLPPEHPCHGVLYNDVRVPGDPDDYTDYPDVHGGLTYSALCAHGTDESTGICHVPREGHPDNVWWLGFDCAHSGDVSPRYERGFRLTEFEVYRNVQYVRQQVKQLAAQMPDAYPKVDS